MDAAVRSALLWGAVGALAFLALHQGSVLLGNRSIGLPAALGIAVAVGAVTTVVAYTTEHRLAVLGR